MKKIACIFLSLCSLVQNAQNFPSVEEAYAKAKASNFDKSLAEYKHVTAQCKFIDKSVGDFTDDGKPTFKKSMFGDYISEKSKKMFPLKPIIDQCEIDFVLETPKDKDGVYFLIPVIIKYTKFNGNTITNNWNFKWAELGDGIAIGLKQANAKEALDLLLNILKSKKGDEHYFTYGGAEGTTVNWNDIDRVLRINDIMFTNSKQETLNEQTFHYIIKADAKNIEKAHLTLADGESIDYFENKETYSILNVLVEPIDYEAVIHLDKTGGNTKIESVEVNPVLDEEGMAKHGKAVKQGETLSYRNTTFADIYKRFSSSYKKEEKN